MLFSKFPSLSFTVSNMMIYDNKSKTLGDCADQMRHFIRILTKQKFFRQKRSIAYIKLFLFIHILKISKIFCCNACSHNMNKTLVVCRNRVRHFKEITTELKFFRKPKSIV